MNDMRKICVLKLYSIIALLEIEQLELLLAFAEGIAEPFESNNKPKA